MNSDRDKRYHELLSMVIDLPKEQWPAFLADGDDNERELRHEVLAALEQEGDLADLQPLAVLPIIEPGEAKDQVFEEESCEKNIDIPSAIGPYRILGLLGEGGMGRVYRAEQNEPVQRQVALKVLTFVTTGEGRMRFEAERHAMGRLDHPNIGKILEAGTTEQGLPYFVMELIDGDPLMTFCDSRSLTIEERLRIFIDVCLGVDHAHRKLLLHRDLKPSNILVHEIDGRPVPKVIDFGIAKFLDEAMDQELTGNRVIGTPLYMSPEALYRSDDIDIRSDVFSLGVLLYELLTGHRPWPDPGHRVSPISQRVHDDAVKRPSRCVTGLDDQSRETIARCRALKSPELVRTLRGDIDWISLKTLASDPEERYSSVAELIADIEHLLQNEPVTARAPTASYLLRKMMRRHRRRFVAAGLVAASLIVGIVGTSVGFVRARAEAARANKEAKAAQAAQKSTNQLASYLKNLFGEVDSSVENPAEITAREILKRGTEGLDTELRDQPIERSALLRTVGEIYSRWEDFDRAESLLLESLALLDEVDPEPSTSMSILSQARVDVLEKIADLRHRQGRFEEAYKLAIEALSAPLDNDESRLQSARLQIQAGSALRMVNRLEEADQRLRLGLEILDDLPESGAHLAILGHAYMELGSVAQRRLDPTALDNLRRAVAVFEQAYGKDSRQVVPALNRLAYGLVDQRALEEAVEVLERTIELEERLFGPETLPVARSLYLLGRVARYQENYVEAEAALRRSVDIHKILHPGKHPLVANALAVYAYMIWLQEDGRYEQVMNLFDEAEANLDGHATVYPVFTAVMELRARVEVAKGRHIEAETYIRRAVDYLLSLEEPPFSHVSANYKRLASVLMAQGRMDEAHDACQESLRTVLVFGQEERIRDRRKELEELGCFDIDTPDSVRSMDHVR